MVKISNDIITGIMEGNNPTYEVGKTYENKENITSSKGNSGYTLHVGSPLIIFEYCHLLDNDCNPSRFFEVFTHVDDAEMHHISDEYVASKMTINKELSFNDLVNRHIDYIENSCEDDVIYYQYSDVFVSRKNGDDLRSEKDYALIAISGNKTKVRSIGDFSKIYSIGSDAMLILNGDAGEITASGENTYLHATGYAATLTSRGKNSELFATGSDTVFISDGDYSRLSAIGNNARCICKGKNSTIDIRGKNCTFYAVDGTVITVFAYPSIGDSSNIILHTVGKHGLKPNTWYAFKNGKFVEVEAEDAESE